MNEIRLSERMISTQESSTVKIADKVKRLRENGERVFDFSAGRAFEPTPAYVVDAAVRAMQNGDTHQTMARGTTNYRVACAAKLLRENNIYADPDKNIVATMGCKQGLTAALLTLIDPNDEVIVEDPCFVSYKQLVQYASGNTIEVPLLLENDYRWTYRQLKDAVTPKTKAIIMCTPHNPTGVVHKLEDIEAVAAVAKEHNLFVITDEPYERTTWGKRRHLNIAGLPGMFDRTVTLMSLTKSFSMGGWRIGFALGSEEIINQLTKLQQHLITCTNSFVQAGGAVAFGEKPQDEVLKYWLDWEEKVVYMVQKLNEINGLYCHMPEGGFYAWVNIENFNLTSEKFCSQLLQQQKTALVPGSSFGKQGEGYVRITCVKSWEEIHGGLEKLKLFCDALHREGAKSK